MHGGAPLTHTAGPAAATPEEAASALAAPKTPEADDMGDRPSQPEEEESLEADAQPQLQVGVSAAWQCQGCAVSLLLSHNEAPLAPLIWVPSSGNPTRMQHSSAIPGTTGYHRLHLMNQMVRIGICAAPDKQAGRTSDLPACMQGGGQLPAAAQQAQEAGKAALTVIDLTGD